MHPKRSLLLVVLVLNILAWSLVSPRSVYAASVRYAVPDGLTTGDCLSWATACTLQRALASAVSGDQIWVKMGTYTPGTAGERTATFTLKNGVTLYGGFPTGTTESRLMDRSYISYPTILSGDLNGNGIDHNDAYRVVTASHTDSSAVLDGFTITGGNANGDATQRSGSGIYIDTGSPTLRNLVISANETDGIGAGLYLYQSSPILERVTFSNNLARMYGGAMYAFSSSPSLTNVIFDNNTVDGGDGGALYLHNSSPTLSNVSFRGNIAIPIVSGNTSAGGSGGAMYVSSASNLSLSNVVFSRNVAGGSGGALDLEYSNPILSNVTFSRNEAKFGGGAIFMNNSSPQIRNSIIWGDGSPVAAVFGGVPVYTRVILQGGGAGTLDADPLFEFALADNLHLRPASPALNYGDNTVTAPGLPATDLDGYPRIADGTVDLGAYENRGPYNTAPVLSGSMSDLALLEDPASNPGHKVSDILSGHVADVDGTAAGAGMAIYAVDNTNGAWQFSNDGGTTWTMLPGTVSGTSSTLLGPDAFVRFMPNADWGSTTTLSFRAWDIPPDLRTSGTIHVNSDVNGGRTSFSAATGTITLVVTPVNDVPSFTGGADQVALKDGGAQTVSAWATDISTGPGDEAAQALNFIVDNDNHALFSAQPAISADGTLTYTPAAGAIGSATVSVSLHDDGGTADGGVDTSATQTFTIFVTPARVFVKANATGAGNGTSWTDAYTDLQTALARTTAGCEIWVAAATYKPGTAGDNAAAFTLKNGVAIYGGFAGTEGSLAERNWKVHPTILSGDLNGDATHDDNDAYHVVMASAVSSATLDGFTITGGNALGGEHETATGGGMALSSSSLTLSNLIFSDNAAAMGGGMALYNSSSPTLNNVAFQGNHAVVTGGGMDLNDNSSPTLNNVIFHGNHTDSYGGGMTLTSSNPILNNVIFSGNHADEIGGGMVLVDSAPILSNVTFSGNHAVTSGGGMLMYRSNPQVRNSILWGNTAGSGAQVYDYGGSTPVYDQVLIQGGGGPLDADPQFVDADGSDGVYGTPDDNLRLNFGSPAIDVGDNFACPFIDLDGLPRPGDGDANGTATCDLGAYEAGEMICAAPYTFANQSGVSIQVDTPGNLACLYVDEMGSDHANATSQIQTGRYWLIRGLQSNKTDPASGFSLTLTLPTNLIPDSKDKLCRYTGSAQNWNCAASGFDAGAKTITRAGITALSDWAVGNDAPTAVRLVSLGARAETQSMPVALILLVVMFGVVWAARNFKK